MPKKKKQPMPSVQTLLEEPHQLIPIQTGNWPGQGGWCYRIWCSTCGWKDYATNYEDACDARRQHREDPEFDTEEEWEEF